MSLPEIILIAIGLSMDAFAVAVCIGTAWRGLDRRGAWRIACHFGFFQFLMPLFGWSLGMRVAPLIEKCDHWVAFALLAIVGLRMIKSGLSAQGGCFCKDPTRGAVLLLLSLATSIDALAVGFSLALLDVQIWYPSVVIGMVTCAFSLWGTNIGRVMGVAYGRRAEVLGGAVLIVIGIRILYIHMAA